MLDHMILTVSNVERSLAFYEAALKPLNIKFFLPYKGEGDHPDLWGFGDGKRAFFWIKQGKPDPASIHWGFMAESNEKVDEFYEAAISAGAKDNISPRARVEYYPGYYAADVFIECKSSSHTSNSCCPGNGLPAVGLECWRSDGTRTRGLLRDRAEVC